VQFISHTNAFRVEKYRPVFLDDVVGNTETIERLKIIARDGNMPHVIISGMPGIGKTTSVLCLARQLLGDSYKEAVLELNASDERGQLSHSGEHGFC
jgi:replication-associated recombination protein RarA